MRLAIISLILLGSVSFALAEEKTDGPSSAAAKAAIAKADKGEAAALLVFKKAMTEVNRILVGDLKVAQKKALDAGDVDEATAIAAYQKKIQATLDDNSNPNEKPKLSGTWEVRYSNGVHRTYRFDRDRASYDEGGHKQDQIQVRLENGDIFLNFPTEGKLERWTFARNKAVVEHFFPASDFQKDKWNSLGAALRVIE